MVQLLFNILGTTVAAECPYNSVIPLLLLVIIQPCDETAAAGKNPYNFVMQLLVLLLLNVLTIL